MFVPQCVCVCVCLVTLVLHHSLCVCDTFHWHSWASFTFGCPTQATAQNWDSKMTSGMCTTSPFHSNVFFIILIIDNVLNLISFFVIFLDLFRFFLNLYVIFGDPHSQRHLGRLNAYTSTFGILYLWLYLYFVFVTHMLCHAPAAGPMDANQQSLARSENAPHCHIPNLRGSPSLPPVGEGSKKMYLGLTKTSRS